MSFSRSMVRLHISAAVAIQRSIGRLLAGGVKKTNIKTKIIPNYFGRKYVPIVKNLKPGPVTVEKPETIWQFWDNPPGQPTPELIKACTKTVEKWKGDFDQKILDMETIENFSNLPGFLHDRLKSGLMEFPHFADLLRLNLLINHGGVWIDATSYMTAPLPKYITDEDFFVFLTGKQTHFPYSFMQNCFIRGKKGSFMAEAWYKLCIEYWKNETDDIDYFLHQLMFKALIEKNPTAKKLFAEMPHVSEDEILQLVGDKLFQEFDKTEWERIKKSSFMQKLTYKSKRRTIAKIGEFPGSYFEKIALGEIS